MNNEHSERRGHCCYQKKKRQGFTSYSADNADDDYYHKLVCCCAALIDTRCVCVTQCQCATHLCVCLSRQRLHRQQLCDLTNITLTYALSTLRMTSQLMYACAQPPIHNVSRNTQ